MKNGSHAEGGTATMTAFAYIGEPDIPTGMTISEYRRCRPRCIHWWRRLPRIAR